MERSACSALNPRERRKPVRYAVDGYGVLSCVIGGMIDRMRISVIPKVYRVGRPAGLDVPLLTRFARSDVVGPAVSSTRQRGKLCPDWSSNASRFPSTASALGRTRIFRIHLGCGAPS